MSTNRKTATKTVKKCDKCGDEFTTKSSPHPTKCSVCDTTQAGNWFCSWLAEAVLESNDGEVFNGKVSGDVDAGWLGLENPSWVRIEVDKDDKHLFHVKAVNFDTYYKWTVDGGDPWDIENPIEKKFRVELKEC